MALPFETDAISWAPLSDACERARFSCGQDRIDGWFQRQAPYYHGRTCRVWVARVGDDPCPVAFYAIGYSVVQLTGNVLGRLMTRPTPSLRLEWLAVRRDLQGKGLGTIVMGRVIQIFSDQIYTAHMPALTLSPAPGVAGFYRKLGFTDLASGDLLLAAADVLNQ